jgi:hypothetical protein
MKKSFLVLVLFVFCGISALYAQTNSLVGKWKVASFKAEGIELDLENPEQIKKIMKEQMLKESGKAADSAQLEMIYQILTSTFSQIQMEFTRDGKAKFIVPNTGETDKPKDATYTVDYTKGTLTTIEKGGVKENLTFTFEGEYLVLTNPAKGNETFKLKRQKQ